MAPALVCACKVKVGQCIIIEQNSDALLWSQWPTGENAIHYIQKERLQPELPRITDIIIFISISLWKGVMHNWSSVILPVDCKIQRCLSNDEHWRSDYAIWWKLHLWLLLIAERKLQREETKLSDVSSEVKFSDVSSEVSFCYNKLKHVAWF